MYDYEEACPVSKAASVLCERWTLQIIREMLLGATRFNELQTYLPRVSPTLLNSRLKSLKEKGIINKRRIPEKKGYEYQLTPCGLQLREVIKAVGHWGMDWVFTSMDPAQLNVSALVRDFAVALHLDALPAGRQTLQFTVEAEDGQIVKKFILVENGKSQLCEENIGHDVDCYLTSDTESLGEIWFGFITVRDAVKQGKLKVQGNQWLVTHITEWLGTSQFSANNRVC